MRVILRSPFSMYSGYGRDGIGLAQALLDRRHEVTVSPTAVQVPLPRDVAGLFCEPVVQSDVAVHHMEPHLVRLAESDAAMARVNIFWSMWGWRNLPDPALVPDGKADWVTKFSDNIANFDYVVVYDPDSAEAFAPHVPAEKLLIVQGGYTAGDWDLPEVRPDAGDEFVFGMVGNLGVRKGSYLAYQAFYELKEEHGSDFNARLVFYTTTPLFPPTVQLIDGVEHRVGRLLPDQLKAVYWGLDTLLAPSMADAKHLPPIEALTCGTPVILSDITGHRTWADSSMVTWVSTHPESLRSPEVSYQGAAVDLDSLKSAMWEHYTNPAAQREKAFQASRTLPAMLDWSKCLERLGLVTRTLL